MMNIPCSQTHGVPQYFGIYYAMGIGLIMEGFMSAFYHICPTNANFQFGGSVYICNSYCLVRLCTFAIAIVWLV